MLGVVYSAFVVPPPLLTQTIHIKTIQNHMEIEFFFGMNYGHQQKQVTHTSKEHELRINEKDRCTWTTPAQKDAHT